MNKIVSAEDHKNITKFYEDYDKTHSLEDTAEGYDARAHLWDSMSGVIGFRQCDVSRELAACFAKEMRNKKLILDVGAGTGLLGKSMADYGFNNLHGLDMSVAMLDEARKINLYGKFFSCPVTADPTPGISTDTYDAVVSYGCFVTQWHIEMDALEELARITKPGGFVVFTLCYPNFETNYMEVLGKFMIEKKVELISMKMVPYKLDYKQNYEQVYAYLVVLKVI